MGKRAKLILVGEDKVFDANRFRDVFRNLIHAVRNAADHALELPGERLAKTETGTLSIEFSRHTDQTRITIEDDGRGIDTIGLIREAVEKGFLTAEQGSKLDQTAAIELIFSSGLSTAEEITDLSGRGLGIGALKYAVEEAGGSITVTSKLGKGTKIVLLFSEEEIVA